MFLVTWLPVLGLLLFYIGAYTTGGITIKYYISYHRCVISPGYLGEIYEEFVFFFVPFFLILLLYGAILFVIVRNTGNCGRFIVTATGIITSNLLVYCPVVITVTWNIPLSYEVSQILNVTVSYINGIVNPMVYLVTHPATWRYVKNWWRRPRMSDSTTQSLGNRSVFELRKSKNKTEVNVTSNSDTVNLPNIEIQC